MGSGGWWAVGAVVGLVWWAGVRGAVRRTVATRCGADAPNWLDRAGWISSAAVLAAVFGSTERTAELPALAGWAAGLVALALVDAATRTLPRQPVWIVLAWSAVALAPIALADGDPERWGRAALGALIAAAVVGAGWAATRGGIGFGDVRLAAPLGFVAAWRSWGALGQAGFWAVVINGAVVAILLVTRRAGRRSKVPLGPSLVAGALLAVLLLERTAT